MVWHKDPLQYFRDLANYSQPWLASIAHRLLYIP
jgi:hypothetical protein